MVCQVLGVSAVGHSRGVVPATQEKVTAEVVVAVMLLGWGQAVALGSHALGVWAVVCHRAVSVITPPQQGQLLAVQGRVLQQAVARAFPALGALAGIPHRQEWAQAQYQGQGLILLPVACQLDKTVD